MDLRDENKALRADLVRVTRQLCAQVDAWEKLLL